MYLSTKYICSRDVLKYIFRYIFKEIKNQLYDSFTHRSTYKNRDKLRNGDIVVSVLIQTLCMKKFGFKLKNPF